MAFDTKALRISDIIEVCSINPQDILNRESPRAYHSILYNIDGIYKFCFGDREIAAEPNSVLYLPKEICIACETVMKGSAVCINFELIREIDARPFLVKCDDTRKIAVLFRNIESEFGKKNTAYKVISDFYKIISLVEHESAFVYAVKSDEEKIKEAIAYIEANYENPKLCTAEVAAHVNLTVPVFRNKFTAICGVSPLKYFTVSRVSAAKKLLEESDMSIEQIAFNVGFIDRYYFSRFFKKNCGLSPSEYRRKCRHASAKDTN